MTHTPTNFLLGDSPQPFSLDKAEMHWHVRGHSACIQCGYHLAVRENCSYPKISSTCRLCGDEPKMVSYIFYASARSWLTSEIIYGQTPTNLWDKPETALKFLQGSVLMSGLN